MKEWVMTNQGLVTGSGAVCADDVIGLRLRRDVEQLASHDRRTSTSGERRSAEWIAMRVRDDIGADDVAITRFRTRSSWAPAQLAYLLAAAVAAALPALSDGYWGRQSPRPTSWKSVAETSGSGGCFPPAEAHRSLRGYQLRVRPDAPWSWSATTTPHTTGWSGIRELSHSTKCGRDGPVKPCPLTSPR
jgi:hypothetical protein